MLKEFQLFHPMGGVGKSPFTGAVAARDMKNSQEESVSPKALGTHPRPKDADWSGKNGIIREAHPD
jgi:hypothetical protein